MSTTLDTEAVRRPVRRSGHLMVPSALFERLQLGERVPWGATSETNGEHVSVWLLDSPVEIEVRFGEKAENQDILVIALGTPTKAWLGPTELEIVVVDPARYLDRFRSLPHAAAVSGKSVCVVGLGSVGSDLGARLARLGLRVIGIDPDVLMVENLVRWGLHVSVGSEIGRPKARVWEDHLRRSVPGADVAGQVLDVVRDEHRFANLLQTEAPELLVVATDTADSRRVAAAEAATFRVPSLFVALSDEAASVRIEVVDPATSGPCHGCTTLAEGGSGARHTRDRYAIEQSAKHAQGVPALPIDIAIGTAVATRVALSLVAGEDWTTLFRRGEQRGTVLYMSLRPDTWVFDEAWDRMVVSFERQPDCPVCASEEAP